MSTLTLDLPPELTGKLVAIADRERRTLEAQVTVFLEQIVASPESFKHPISATSGEVTLAQLVPLMPPGLRSRASVQRLLAARAISGRKVRGTWSFKPSKVLADLDHFEQLSAADAVERRAVQRRGSKAAKTKA